MASRAASKPKTKRAKTPHTRGGCTTCKVRHIKCDQEKPICKKCKQFSWDCDYPPVKTKVFETRKLNTRQIMPMPNPNNVQPVLLALPLGSPFKSEKEYQCFNVFRTDAVGDLRRFFDFDVWNHIVLQACDKDSPVTHAAIAFGALRSTQTFKQNKEFAFERYSKALALLGREKPTELVALRKILITLLLCINFEVLAGFPDAVTNLTLMGTKLLEEFLTSPKVKRPFRISGDTQLDSSPIENELVQTFRLMEVWAISYKDTRPQSIHAANRSLGVNTIEAMPHTFRTMKEAEMHLQDLCRRTMHWFATLVNLAPPSTNKAKMGTTQGPAFPPVNIAEDQKSFMDEFSGWHDKLEALLAGSQTLTQKDHQRALYVRPIHLGGFLLVSTLGIVSDAINQKCDAALEEILSLSYAILLDIGIPKQNDKYSRDSVPILWGVPTAMQLIMVGMRFRNRRLRKRAIELLVLWPRRERVWNTRPLGLVIEWIDDLEGIGLGDDVVYVPEKCLIRKVRIENDFQKKKTKASCEQSTARGWVRKKKTVKWDDSPSEDLGAEDLGLMVEETDDPITGRLFNITLGPN